MSTTRDGYARSLMAFRPSIYTTGIQEIQPYTPMWPEGSEYGTWWGDEQTGSVGGTCTDHAGLVGTIGSKVSCAALADAQAGRAPGTTPTYEPVKDTALTALVDLPGTAFDFTKNVLEELQEELSDRAAEEAAKKQRQQHQALWSVAAAVALGVTSLVIFQRYRTMGRVI